MSVVVSSLETNEKFRAYFRTRDRRVRDELVEQHFPLARLLAGRFRNGSEPFDDLVQAASIGLLKAVERYNPEYGTSFSTFAVPTILGELKRHLRDHTWLVHASRRDKDLRLQVRAATEDAQHRLHDAEPSRRDIAAQAGLSESEVLRGQLTLNLYNTKAVDASIAAEEIGTDDGFAQVEAASVVQSLVAELPQLERGVLRAYYREGRSQADIGRQLGRSQMFVSRNLARSRNILRAKIATNRTDAVVLATPDSSCGVS
jgi:RNA polymerase sigma-B factor